MQQGDRHEVGTIARFSDTDHNIIEEAALTLANMKPEDIERIHEGTRRDYSQSPAQLNLLLQWGAFGKKTPIAHIDEELVKFVHALPAKAAFEHVGSAFHAIEDFFAHSNFIELAHGDFVHGRELITGSVGGSDDVSLLKILETIRRAETLAFGDHHFHL